MLQLIASLKSYENIDNAYYRKNCLTQHSVADEWMGSQNFVVIARIVFIANCYLYAIAIPIKPLFIFVMLRVLEQTQYLQLLAISSYT